jgi:hypothetical protein
MLQVAVSASRVWGMRMPSLYCTATRRRNEGRWVRSEYSGVALWILMLLAAGLPTAPSFLQTGAAWGSGEFVTSRRKLTVRILLSVIPVLRASGQHAHRTTLLPIIPRNHPPTRPTAAVANSAHRPVGYVDKTYRRGKIGGNAGRRIEVAPHYRCPHMALVWTGRGRAVPKVAPRRGSVVHRELVGKVPNGFEDRHFSQDAEDERSLPRSPVDRMLTPTDDDFEER